jgi:hypothetical protein
MQLTLVVCSLAFYACNNAADAPAGVGDPCIPGEELHATGSFQKNELGIEVDSVQCETRVCLRHYFQGRVSCPYGNNDTFGQAADPSNKCHEVKGRPGLFTLEGNYPGTLCCPVLGDPAEKPMNFPVSAQCSKRGAKDAVYCSCRCDVPADPDIDRSLVNLCKCPDSYSCVALCDAQNGDCATLPKGKWGSYCVKNDQAGYDQTQQDALCGPLLTPP